MLSIKGKKEEEEEKEGRRTFNSVKPGVDGPQVRQGLKNVCSKETHCAEETLVGKTHGGRRRVGRPPMAVCVVLRMPKRVVLLLGSFKFTTSYKLRVVFKSMIMVPSKPLNLKRTVWLVKTIWCECSMYLQKPIFHQKQKEGEEESHSNTLT